MPCGFLFTSCYVFLKDAYTTSPQCIVVLSHDVDKLPEQQIHSQKKLKVEIKIQLKNNCVSYLHTLQEEIF